MLGVLAAPAPAAASADGRFIVTADDSGVVRFFALDAVDLIKQVCDRALLEFTAAQWNEYLWK